MSADTTPAERPANGDLFISPDGDDAWSGTHPEPTDDGTDGPLATLEGAKRAIQDRKRCAALARPLTVWLRGGRYAIDEPITFDSDDGGPITYAAYPCETPVIDGGVRIDDWSETNVNGTTVWVADLPAVARDEWSFASLFVDGERRPRPRLPKGEEEFFWIEDVPGAGTDGDHFTSTGTQEFVAREGDLDPDWRNLSDVEVVALHYWIEERLPIESIDSETNRVGTELGSVFSLVDDVGDRFARYYVENVFDALSEPGEWYLDRPAGDLYYVPKAGETPENTAVIAPKTTQLIELAGNPEAGAHVEHLRFQGLTFRHTDWEQIDPAPKLEAYWPQHYDGETVHANVPQAAFHLPGVISATGARHCTIEDCTIEHVGFYGIELGDGCHGNRIVGNEIADTGGGGVKVSGARAGKDRARRTGENRVTDNHIHNGGLVFHSSIGVLVRHAFDLDIAHNHVHDYYYSGISVGWVWGYAEHTTRDVRIENNHIHDIGKGLLSDMGGIYTLGVQPGSVVRGNHVHDVRRRNYGGWAIYTDEGSSHILIENNLAHDTDSQPFHQHYGRENIIRNNVFAFGGEGQITLTRLASGRTGKRVLADNDEYASFTFQRNIVVTDGQPVFVGRRSLLLDDDSYRSVLSDANLLWDVRGDEPRCASGTYDAEANWVWIDDYTLEEWRESGLDRHSIVTEPQFFEPETRTIDVSAFEGSPSDELGLEPFDVDDAGPRPPEKRE